MRLPALALLAVMAGPASAAVLDPSGLPEMPVATATTPQEAMSAGVDGVGSLLTTLRDRANGTTDGEAQLIEAVSAVPVPAALPLLALGLGALGFAARRRRD